MKKNKVFEITATLPHRPFTKGQKKTYFRQAPSKKYLMENSWLFNNCGVFSGVTATEKKGLLSTNEKNICDDDY